MILREVRPRQTRPGDAEQAGDCGRAAPSLQAEDKDRRPAQAQLPDGRTVYVNGEAAFDVRLRLDTAGLYAPAITLTYTSPTKTATYRRKLRHPPIYVIPAHAPP